MTPEVVEVLAAISDDFAFNIIDIVVNSAETAEGLRDKLNISSKQCHDRIRKLLDIGIIKRKGLNYTITSFGRLMYQTQLKVAKVAQDVSKLKLIDAAVSNGGLARKEYVKLIEVLINDDAIKDLIVSSTDQ
jgi:DNA-binding Lrp family transcriptional regulator